MMGPVRLVVLLMTLLFLGVCCADDIEEIQEDTDVRDGREFSPESWRAVENDRLETSGWIPQETPSEHPTPILKRRRLRKRKRRPVQAITNDPTTLKMQDRLLYLPGRRQRPIKFGQTDDVWDEMHLEGPKQAVNRRRVVPEYHSGNTVATEARVVPEYPSGNTVAIETEPEIVTRKQVDINPLSAVIRFEEPVEETTKPRTTEKIRDPFDALKEAEEKQKTPEEIRQTAAPSNLKSLLKKSGGTISLSEILQQRNLSLAELLTGNAEAISALTAAPDSTEPTEMMEFSEPTKYQRVPPSERKKITDRVSESEESEEIAQREKLEAQRKRLAVLNAHKENKVYLGITHTYEIVTEPVTERRIFVPSHPKRYSTSSYKPLLFQNSIKSTTQIYTNEIEQKTIKPEPSNTPKPFKFPMKKLPITSAKLLTKTTKKTPEETKKVFTIPPKAIQINLDEILKKEESFEQSKDEPLQISLNFENQKETDDNSDSNEKMKIVRPGEEIMEILEDPIYKDKLSRILQERNMTIQELVDQRERGSSQLHLADIFHNKTREPEPIDEPYVGLIMKNDIYPESSREQKSIKFDENKPKTENLSSETKIDNQSSEEVTISSTEKKPAQLLGFGMNNSFNYAAIMPFWKQFHPEVFTHFYKEDETKSFNEIKRIEEIDNNLSDATNDKFNVELNQRNYHLDEESIFDIPTGIKSALLASIAIVGLSLFMFLTILLIFKWTQRKKNKLNYMSSLSGVKIKSPILEVPRRSALRTFVCETLGRKTNFYKSNLQSMSDVWDEKKQKF